MDSALKVAKEYRNVGRLEAITDDYLLRVRRLLGVHVTSISIDEDGHVSIVVGS